jgi:subtilisin family serine protease
MRTALILATLALAPTAFAHQYIIKLKDSTPTTLTRNLTYLTDRLVLAKTPALKELAQYVEWSEEDREERETSEGAETIQIGSEQWHHSTLNSFSAWMLVSEETRRRTTVAVCDSGVDVNHPDLGGNLVLPGFNSYDGSRNIKPSTAHGTMVAGLIASTGTRNPGVFGMASKLTVYPIRITHSAGSAYISSMVRCIQHAADRGIRVINLSFTGASSKAIDEAARYARARGSLLFMSAANGGSDISESHPDYDSFILVGATDEQDQRASFSNWGTPIDLTAPGTRVMTTTWDFQYARVSGTSFSSPITAGLAAYVLSVRPRLTVQALEEVLLGSTDPVGEEYVFGRGRINAERAIIGALRR